MSGAFAGTPVVLTGADTQCGVLGAGTANEGDVGVVAGWSAPVQMVLDRPLLDAKRRTWTGLHVMPDRWVLESNAGDTGRAWDWVCTMLGLTPEAASALAETAPTGAHDALFVLGRAPMNAAQMTAGVGAFTFPTPIAMSSLGRADVLRATLEAAAYAIRANVEQLEEVSARKIPSIRLGGGMSQSAVFGQILASVLERRVEVARSPQTTAVGAAALAFVATGVFASIVEAVAAMTEPREIIEPNARDSAVYEDCYARWRMLVKHMEQAP
jgi:autoinducer 2 (AI-2) kinase